MSTSEQLQEEQPPNPQEIIEAFLATNRTLVGAISQAHSMPSFQSLAEVDTHVTAAKEAMKLYHARRFFGDSDPADIEFAVNSIIVASQEVALKSHEINAEQPMGAVFDAGFKEQVIGGLSDEESAEVAATHLCNIYGGFVAKAQEALLTSESVLSFAMAHSERQEKIKNAKRYGATALAVLAGTFAGTYLGNRLQNRR